MGDKLDKSIIEYTRSTELSARQEVSRDSRALLIVTLFYLIALLSMPLKNLSGLIWFGVYPILGAALLGQSFNRIFLKSTVVLPFVLMIGIFNPVFDQTEMTKIGPWELSHGWITFISITLRGLFALQALLLLTESCGFIGMCRAMRQLYVPAFLTTQLEMVYRYSGTIMEELRQMKRARQARGYGHKAFGLRLWGAMIGQLFIRSIDRAERVNKAMICRGFTGTIPDYVSVPAKWKSGDTIYLLGWTAAFAILRFYNPQLLFS